MIIGLLFVGIMLFIVKRRSGIAKGLLIAGFLLLCVLSFAPLSNLLLWELECKYPPLMDYEGREKMKYIVVLTAWDSDVQTIPYIQNLGYRSTFRALEAHRQYKGLGHGKIIISGNVSGAKLMSTFLVLLSVPVEDIIVDHSENTLQSAVNLRGVLGNQPFILVTSAVHLHRSMSSFIHKGLRPVPAPADYLYGYYPEYQFPFPRPFSYYIPNTDSFMRSSSALYEYMGIAWYYLKSWCEK